MLIGHNQRLPQTNAFTPASLPGLLVWLDATNVNSVHQSGGAVSQWDDLSGRGNNFVQASGANQPIWGFTEFNFFKPGVTFSSANSTNLDCPSVAVNSSLISVFVILTFPTGFGNSGVGYVSFLGAADTLDFSGASSFVLTSSLQGSGAVNYRNTSLIYDDSQLATTVANAGTGIGWIFDGASGTGFLNFTGDTAGAKSGAFGNPTARINLGGRLSPTVSGPFLDATIGEVLIGAGNWTSQLTSLHIYWQNKWFIP